jgi:2-dehydropantoate 2-reductase
MRVLIFGTGGVGSIYAYILESAGAHVTAVCRSNFTAVQQNGITITSALFGTVRAHPIAVRTAADAAADAAAAGHPFDFILVCAKALPGTADLIAPAVSSPTTAIVLCQNGIDIEPPYAARYPRNTILSAVVYLPTTQTSPGHVTMGPLQKLQVGTYPARAASTAAAQAQAATFAATFTAGGGVCELLDDVQQARWVKLAVNAAWNPMCALTRCSDAELLRSSAGADGAVVQVMREVARVAAAAGYRVDDGVLEEQMERPRGRLATGGKEPSMLTDVRERRALEVDAILGSVLRIARGLGVEAPRLELLFALAGGLSYSIRPDGESRPPA